MPIYNVKIAASAPARAIMRRQFPLGPVFITAGYDMLITLLLARYDGRVFEHIMAYLSRPSMPPKIDIEQTVMPMPSGQQHFAIDSFQSARVSGCPGAYACANEAPRQYDTAQMAR